jgi:hypothetical protein
MINLGTDFVDHIIADVKEDKILHRNCNRADETCNKHDY